MADQQLTTKFEVRLSKNGTVAEILVPGFGYSDFDRAGRINAVGVAKLFEAGRLLTLRQGYLDYKTLLQKGFVALLGIRYTLDPSFLRSLRVPFNVPMKVSLELCNIGKSSFTWRQTLKVVQGSQEWVAGSTLTKMVFLDRSTRKSSPLPAYFSERYRPYVGQIDHLELAPLPDIPKNAFQVTFAIRHSDMDTNLHVNNSVYLRLCLDTAAAAIDADALPGFHGDICLYPLEEMGVQYRQESFAGDTLTVHVWGAGGPGCLAFVITKKGVEGPIFFADMKFSLPQYPPLARL